MDYTVSIKFRKKNETTPKNINNVIALIPVVYKKGHTQTNIMYEMLVNPTYTINFRDNKNAAENFFKTFLKIMKTILLLIEIY